MKIILPKMDRGSPCRGECMATKVSRGFVASLGPKVLGLVPCPQWHEAVKKLPFKAGSIDKHGPKNVRPAPWTAMKRGIAFCPKFFLGGDFFDFSIFVCGGWWLPFWSWEMISLQVDLGNDSLRVLLNMGCFCLAYARPILHRFMQKQQTRSLRLERVCLI